MEFGADFSHDEGKDDLLALRAALDNYHRADEPWVEKPFEATLLTARKIILSDETMGAIADLEIRLARYDTLIGCSPYRSTVVQLMSRFEGGVRRRRQWLQTRLAHLLLPRLLLGPWRRARRRAQRRPGQGHRRRQPDRAVVALRPPDRGHRHAAFGRGAVLHPSLGRAHHCPQRRPLPNHQPHLGARHEEVGPPVEPQGRGGGYKLPAASSLKYFLEDLADFTATSKLDPITKSALIFFQIDSVRMFPHHFDQLGRIISFYLWRHTGVVMHAIPPISVTPAIHPQKHLEKLKPYLHQGETVDMLILDDWIYHAARSTQNAVELERACLAEVERQIAEWQECLKSSSGRSTGTIHEILPLIFVRPVFSVSSLAKDAHSAYSTANQMVLSLERAGIVRQVSAGRRNKLYECPDALNFFGKMVPELASL
ncbi:hypothetical protein [Adlercreutzia equolifaciens]|uniref:hypothetical protein n=1 Tax=Adlercreutzia equolifaciens TaxID=446660 RepID=UPI003AB4866E